LVGPLDPSANYNRTIRRQECLNLRSRLLHVSCSHDVKNVAKNTRNKRLSIRDRRFTFNHESRIVRNPKQLAQRAITTIDLRDFEGPLRIIRHFEAVSWIQKECDGRIRSATIRMLFYKVDKLIGDAAERIQLKRMIARAGF